MQNLVAVNEKGHRIGESHHRAKLSDHDVDLIRALRDEGLTYASIAKKFDVSKETIADIVKCRSRYQVADRWKPLPVKCE